MADETETRQGEPDDSEPSSDRQAELRAVYEANVKVGKPPYTGASIRTRGEFNWIVRERRWRTTSVYTIDDTIDLRDTGIVRAVLKEVDLTSATLSGATIIACYFTGATLAEADLSGTNIVGCEFTDADLQSANLVGSHLTMCYFTSANLRWANLSDAVISNCSFQDTRLPWANVSGAIVSGDFFGADLRQARMDAATILGASPAVSGEYPFQLDERTRLLDISWNGAILANVRWEQVPRLGDEVNIKAAQSRKARVETLRNAAHAYQGLAKALQAQGLTAPALRYRAREQQLERRAQLYSFALGPWVFSWLLNLVSGYGDRPGRALACYLAVVGAFTGTYWAITNQVFGFIQSHSAHLAWYEALVLSISSFHGRGFFPSMLSLGDPIAVVAAAEAIIGLFIELVFIATFTQRFFAR